MSLLGRLAVGWHPERAATIALAHILDVDASPGMASAFVDFVGQTGSLRFEPSRVESDLDQKDDSRPDVTIYDTAERPRVFIEAAFWEGVPGAQPAKHLGDLPDDLPSTLAYIAPRKRIHSLWKILRERYGDGLSDRTGVEERGHDAVWARTGDRVLMVASWKYVLDELRRITDDSVVEQDIAQLRGLTKQMEATAFPPLKKDEADKAVARRLLDYRHLVDKIARGLQKQGVARAVRYSRPSYHMQRDAGLDMLVRDKFAMRFGIELRAWRDSGTTPLWWVLRSSDSFSVHGHWGRIKRRLNGVRSHNDSLYIPVRLRTGVDEGAVIDDAVQRMCGIADVLVEVCQNEPPPQRAAVARPNLLSRVLLGIGRQPEPAATRALHSILDASPEIAQAFIDLLRGGDFEIGRIGCEWFYPGRASPDLSIHDTGETPRIFVENKFGANLTPRQPVAYLERFRDTRRRNSLHRPKKRLVSLWDELKAKCISAKLELADESPRADVRRVRVDSRTLLITSWERVLEALQRVATERGHSAIEQDIAQLRGLTDWMARDGQ